MLISWLRRLGGEALLGLGVLVLIFVLIVMTTVFLLWALHHPIYGSAAAILIGSVLVPLSPSLLLRRGPLRWLRGTLGGASEPSRPALTRSGSFWLAAFAPLLLGGVLWLVIAALLVTKQGTDKVQVARQHLVTIFLFSVCPNVLLAYVCVSARHPYLGLYFAIPTAYIVASSAIRGLQSVNGVLGYFGAYQAQSSPAFISTCAAVYAGSLGAVHYAIGSIQPSQYNQALGWQNAFYFSVTTMATVGYGDIIPLGTVAKWTCVLEIMSGFALLVMALNASMAVWIQGHQPIANPASEKTPSDPRPL